jgi:protein phosphatase 1G
MGAALTYLEKPRKDPHIESFCPEGAEEKFEIAVGSMQGWRRSMEDAHCFDYEDSILITGVFDGHGGKGVALFVAARLPKLLRSFKSYQEKNYSLAIHECFLALDVELRTEIGHKEVERLHNLPNVDDNEDQEEETIIMDLESLVEIFLDIQEENPNDPDYVPLFTLRNDVDIAKVLRKASKPDGEDPLHQIFEGKLVDKLKPIPGKKGTYNVPLSLVFLFIDKEVSPFGQGCTATVALIDFNENKIYCGNAGDSRTVLCRNRVNYDLSVDHKPWMADERARIKEAGGKVEGRGDNSRVQGDLNLSRAIGDLRYKTNTEISQELQIISVMPDIRVRQISSKDDYLILACDGIWDKFSNSSAVKFINDRIDYSLATAIEETFNEAICKNIESSDYTGCDNMTLMIIKFHQNYLQNLPDNVHESPLPMDPIMFGPHSNKRKPKDEDSSSHKKKSKLN